MFDLIVRFCVAGWCLSVVALILLFTLGPFLTRRRRRDAEITMVSEDAAHLADCFHSTDTALSFRQCCEAHRLFEDRTTV